MNECNERPLVGDLSPETDPTVGELAATWELVGRLPASRPSAEFVERLTASLRAEMASRSLARQRAERARPHKRVWGIVAAAAGVVAAVWVAWGFLGRTDDASHREVAVNVPTPAPTPTTLDLTAVESVPADVVAAVDGLAEIRIETETLEQEIKAIAAVPVLTAESLAERFPFLENTFEQTLDGL